MYKIDLSSKVAWVTGGSRGIGRSICLALAEAGCRVALTYIKNKDAADEVVQMIQSKGGKALAVQGDVSNIDDISHMHEKIVEIYGDIEILINNAAITRDNLVLMTEKKDWHDIIQTNLMSAVWTSKLVARSMMAKRYGRIINISSVAANKGGRGQSNYAASKAALEAFSRSFAAELGRKNITVNCVAPGVVDTKMSEEIMKLAKDEVLNRQIIKRLAKPDEIAAAVLYLASDLAGFTTGSTIAIDGGMKIP